VGHMDKHQDIWDAKYEKMLQGERTLVSEPWLDQWLHLVPRGGRWRALDVGCGSGHNTRLLLEHGFEVTAIDISERALEFADAKPPRPASNGLTSARCCRFLAIALSSSWLISRYTTFNGT